MIVCWLDIRALLFMGTATWGVQSTDSNRLWVFEFGVWGFSGCGVNGFQKTWL